MLAQVAVQVLGDRAVAMTAVSSSLPAAEREEAESLARRMGIRYLLVDSKELDDPRYAVNPVNRCYFCKSELFAVAVREANRLGLSWVVDGTQLDDLKDVRPGRQAAKEWKVRSPLVETEFTKEEVRQASRELGLPTWDKPAMACLASRLPMGMPVSVERLGQIERCEAGLKSLGFRQVRARHQGPSVRLELEPMEIYRLSDSTVRSKMLEHCQAAGFSRVLIDLEGYRA